MWGLILNFEVEKGPEIEAPRRKETLCDPFIRAPNFDNGHAPKSPGNLHLSELDVRRSLFRGKSRPATAAAHLFVIILQHPNRHQRRDVLYMGTAVLWGPVRDAV
jgi:hypothetical protein